MNENDKHDTPTPQLPAAGTGMRDGDLVPGGFQHRERRVPILRLEIVGERVDEQDDVGCCDVADVVATRAQECVVAPARQRSSRR